MKPLTVNNTIVCSARNFEWAEYIEIHNSIHHTAASPPVRVKAAGYLALKAAVMVVLAYAVKQERQQHIISATEIAAAQPEKTAAEAEIQKIDAKIKKATGDTPMPEITTPAKGVFAVRKPTTAGK